MCACVHMLCARVLSTAEADSSLPPSAHCTFGDRESHWTLVRLWRTWLSSQPRVRPSVPSVPGLWAHGTMSAFSWGSQGLSTVLMHAQRPRGPRSRQEGGSSPTYQHPLPMVTSPSCTLLPRPPPSNNGWGCVQLRARGPSYTHAGSQTKCVIHGTARASHPSLPPPWRLITHVKDSRLQLRLHAMLQLTNTLEMCHCCVRSEESFSRFFLSSHRASPAGPDLLCSVCRWGQAGLCLLSTEVRAHGREPARGGKWFRALSTLTRGDVGRGVPGEPCWGTVTSRLA